MAKEFLQKHFIEDVKCVLNKGGGSPRLQTKTFNKNGVYRPDPGYTGFSEIIIEVGGDQPSEPSIAAGLYETGTNYGTMIQSWDELVESGKIVVDNGVVYRGATVPDSLPEVNEYGFYFDTMYCYPERGAGIVFHADGLISTYTNGRLSGIESAVYSANTADLSYVGLGVGTFSDSTSLFFMDAYFTVDFSAALVAPLNGDFVLPNDGSITSIGDYRFDGVEFYVGNMAFSGCKGLTGIVIPESVISISAAAFSNCYALTTIEIPSSVTNIGDGAFVSCKGLVNIKFSPNEIPSNVTTIGEHAFQLCENLESVVIPALVTSIGAYAFDTCSSLAEISVLAETPPLLGYYAFGYCPFLTTIKVPASSVDAYKTADGWSEYADIIVAIA